MFDPVVAIAAVVLFVDVSVALYFAAVFIGGRIREWKEFCNMADSCQPDGADLTRWDAFKSCVKFIMKGERFHCDVKGCDGIYVGGLSNWPSRMTCNKCGFYYDRSGKGGKE